MWNDYTAPVEQIKLSEYNARMTFERFLILLNIGLVGWALSAGYDAGHPKKYFGEGQLLTYLSAFNLVGISAFCWVVYQRDRSGSVRQPWQSPAFIWGLMGAGFLFLAFDEALSIHEGIDHFIHHTFRITETRITDRLDDLLIGLYGLIGLGALWCYRHGLLRYRQHWPLLLAGFVALAITIFFDLLTNRHDIIVDRGLHTMFALLEEIVEVCGEMFFLMAAYRCHQQGTLQEVAEDEEPFAIAPARENRRITWGLVIGVTLFGISITLLNAGLPIVRNSIIYAGIVNAITDHGPIEAANYALNKPVGFAILSWPFAALFGVNAGLKFSSMLWTALWVFSIPFFVRRLLRHEGEPQGLVPLVILLTIFNPLVIYQFSSAYADTLFALGFLWSIIFLDRTFARDATRFDGPMLALLLLFSIWVKHHGFVLIPIIMVFIWYRREVLLWQMRDRRQIFYTSVISLVGALLIIMAAQAGLVPTFNLGHNQSNFTGGSDRFEIVVNNASCTVAWLIVSFGLLAPLFLLRTRGARRWHEWRVTLMLFIAPLLFYAGVRDNIRYFLPMTPVLAMILAMALWRLPTRGRQAALALFLLFNGGAITYYCTTTGYEVLEKRVKLPVVENLRLNGEQRRESENLRFISRNARLYDNTLVYLSKYYKEGTYDIWHRAGLFPPGITIYNSQRWYPGMEEKYKLNKAIIYEYIGFGGSKNRIKHDRTIRKHIGKINRSLYIYDAGAILSGGKKKR